MNWFALAILAPLLWAASNLIDGYVVCDARRSPLVMVAVTGVFGALPAIIIFGSGHAEKLSAASWLLGITAGLVGLAVYYPYLKALQSVHPASAVLMWNATPVLVAGLAFAFLNERLPAVGYWALVLLVVSSCFASTTSGAFSGSSRATAWMAVASLLSAIEATFEKRLFGSTSATMGIAAISLTSGVAGLVLLGLSSPRGMPRLDRVTALLGANEMINLTATLLASLAVSRGPVSLVKAVEGLQPLFVLGFARIATVASGGSLRALARAPRLAPSVVATGLAVLAFALLRSN